MFWNGGGSGIFSSLLFVNFTTIIFSEVGKNRKQININCTGTYSLGDRSSTKISLDKIKNNVIVQNQNFQTGKIDKFEIKL